MKRLLIAAVALILLAGCATAPQGASKSYTAADLDAAIAIAQAHNDAGPLACYQALKAAVAIQVAGPVSSYEAARVSLPAIKLACVPISLP